MDEVLIVIVGVAALIVVVLLRVVVNQRFRLNTIEAKVGTDGVGFNGNERGPMKE